jgi:hypothetical protein
MGAALMNDRHDETTPVLGLAFAALALLIMLMA